MILATPSGSRDIVVERNSGHNRACNNDMNGLKATQITLILTGIVPRLLKQKLMALEEFQRCNNQTNSTYSDFKFLLCAQSLCVDENKALILPCLTALIVFSTTFTLLANK